MLVKGRRRWHDPTLLFGSFSPSDDTAGVCPSAAQSVLLASLLLFGAGSSALTWRSPVGGAVAGSPLAAGRVSTGELNEPEVDTGRRNRFPTAAFAHRPHPKTRALASLSDTLSLCEKALFYSGILAFWPLETAFVPFLSPSHVHFAVLFILLYIDFTSTLHIKLSTFHVKLYTRTGVLKISKQISNFPLIKVILILSESQLNV